MEKEKEIPSWEEIKAMMAENARGFVELRESQKKTDEQLEITLKGIRELEANSARTDAQLEITLKGIRELEANSARTDAQLAETLKGISKLEAKTDEINGEVKGIGESNGKFSESYFYNSLFNSMEFGGKNFDEIDKGLKRAKKLPDGKKLKGEYDVVMYNGDTIALIEVKYKVQKEHIEKLRTKQLSVFKEFFPQYKNYNFYLGIAGLSFEEGTEEMAKDYGMGILKPKGESVEILDKKLKIY